MDNDTRHRGKAATICDLVRHSAERCPCVVLVEDVHWAGSTVLAYLARLAETTGKWRALLVMTSRIEGDPINQAWRSTADGAPLVTIDLGPLRPFGGTRACGYDGRCDIGIC